MKTTQRATVALIAALAAGAHVDIEGQSDAQLQDEGQMLAQASRFGGRMANRANAFFE